MKSNYKPIGEYIRLVDERNVGLKVTTLLGLSISKEFIPSVANTIGSDMENYKIIRRNQFACSLMQVRRDKKIPVALLRDFEEAIISQAYPVFEVIDKDLLLPEYLMMWFSRSEFDRESCFYAVGGVRGSLEWEDFCNMQLPIPSPKKQKEIVAEYNIIVDRIKLNEQLNQKLEETAQAIYKQWFVDVEFSDKQRSILDEYIMFNPKHSIKKHSLTSYVEMADLQEDKLSIRNVIARPFTGGSKFKQGDTLLARITPCLENGKIAFVDCLREDDVAYGSTEFIVMRARKGVSPYWVYCLARDVQFRDYAISSMVGSSGRQRVHSDYLKKFNVPKIELVKMKEFSETVKPFFDSIKIHSRENQHLKLLLEVLLSSLATKCDGR